MKILVTGTAGFIGFHLVKALLERGDEIIGLDNINEYYDINLKYARLQETGIDRTSVAYNKLIKSSTHPKYRFIKLNLEDKANLFHLFSTEKPDRVCHLAAQAGVRYSLENPDLYIQSNIIGFLNILEACRNSPVSHLVFASSSSVYGLNQKQPFSTKDNTSHPISLYAATKKSNELMAHTYSYLYNIPVTGLRFFTAYGPWGRPDMAPHLFTKAILEGKPIDVYNNGEMKRDFTYVEDIANGLAKVLNQPPQGNANWNGLAPDPSASTAAYRLYNIGNHKAIRLMDFIEAIEDSLGIKAIKNYLPLQDGDVVSTFADVSDLEADFHYKPQTSLNEGIKHFTKWFTNYYKGVYQSLSINTSDE